ncbi:MAG: ABC transporter permease [Anaerolineaceae bacterium]|nr:MAG: ABC transporter permease [Anaerolineaceae bacterium]
MRRVLDFVLVIWLAATLAFMLLRVLPGDAISAQLALSGASRAEIEAIRDDMGLSAPLSRQYLSYIGGLLRGDMGYSLTSTLPVVEVIAPRLLPTLILALTSGVCAAVGGVLIGAACLNTGGVGRIARAVVNLSLSLPIYWTGTLAIIVFSSWLGWLPSSGTHGADRLILPVLVLSIHVMAPVARVTYANLRQIHDATFVRVARAKGLPELLILRRHILRAALGPVIAVIALQTGFLLSGAVITESVFARSGVGQLLLVSTLDRDYPVVQGIVVLSAVFYMLVNVIADWSTRLLDPRIVS